MIMSRPPLVANPHRQRKAPHVDPEIRAVRIRLREAEESARVALTDSLRAGGVHALEREKALAAAEVFAERRALRIVAEDGLGGLDEIGAPPADMADSDPAGCP